MRRVLLSGGLSVLKDGSDDHDIQGFQRIILREIDGYLFSLRKQIQHDVGSFSWYWSAQEKLLMV